MASFIAFRVQSGKKYFPVIAALLFSLVLVLTGCDGGSKDSSGGGTPNEEVTLSGLSVSSGSLSPVFSSGTTSYTASVAYGTDLITVTPTATEPDDVTIMVNGTTVSSGAGCSKTLSEGQNTFEIVVAGKVTSASMTYTIVVTVLSDETDVTLSGLSISAGSISSFSSGTTSYSVSVANGVTSTTVTPTAAAPDDVDITVNGPSVSSGSASDPITLSVGNNTINIVVTSKINPVNKTTYSIIITRAGADPTGSLEVTVNFTNTEITPSEGNILYLDIFYSQSSLMSWANDVTGTVTSDASSQVTLEADDITNGGVTETFTDLDTGATALYVCAFVDLNSNGSLDDDELVEFYNNINLLDALYWAAGSGGTQPTDAKGSSTITIDLNDVYESPGGGSISYAIDGGSTVILTDVSANYSNVSEDTYVGDTDTSIIGFYFPGSSTGFFDQGDDDVDFFVIDSGYEYWMSGATGINVTQYGEVGGTITGNFSCVLTNKDDSSDTITVTGTFSVLRVVDYD